MSSTSTLYNILNFRYVNRPDDEDMLYVRKVLDLLSAVYVRNRRKVLLLGLFYLGLSHPSFLATPFFLTYVWYAARQVHSSTSIMCTQLQQYAFNFNIV
jgi:hypothetical protein